MENAGLNAPVIPPEQKAQMSARIAQQQGKTVSAGTINPSMPNRGKQIAMEVKNSWVDDTGVTGDAGGWVDDPYSVVAAPEQPKPKEIGDTSRGFKRAFAQVPELAYGTGALIGMTAENLFGEGGISTATKDYFAQKFQQKQQENQKYAPTVEFDTAWEGLKNGDVGSMADWIQDSAGYVVGQGLQTLATGGVGAVAGKAALTKMLGGMAAKSAEKIVAESAGKITLEQATKMAATRMAQAIGAGTALSAQNLGMEAGDIYGGLIDQAQKEGKPITGDDLLRAWGSAAAAAGTETATDLLGLGALTGRVKIPGAKGRAARGAVAAGIGLPIEAGQEYVQTGLEQYGAGKPLDTPEAARERLNAAAVGGMGGALVGGGAGVLSPNQSAAIVPPPTEEKPKTPIEQARADAEILKAGKLIPEADESRVKKATLIALYGENNAVRQAIEGDHPALIDRMLKVAPKVSQIRDARAQAETEQARAESVLAKIESAKAIPEEKQTPMQAALAKAKALKTKTKPVEEPTFAKLLDKTFPENKGQKIAAEKAAAQAKIAKASKQAATSPKNNLPEPTEAQKEAGNYQKGHITLNGLDIAIENPKGSERAGTDADGKPWAVKMQNPYGYIKRSEGGDGEQVDVYLGDHITSESPVFVIDQIDPKTGKFDEHKTVIGARGYGEAKEIYDAHFSDNSGESRRGAVSKMSPDEFKAWLKGDTTGPVKYVPRETKGEQNASTIRSDAGQARPGRAEGQSEIRRGAGEGSENLQQQAQEKPSNKQAESRPRTEEIKHGTEAPKTVEIKTPEPKESTTAAIKGSIKVLSDGRYAAVGFAREQLIKAGVDERSIDDKGTGVYPAKTNKIQLERALGISTLPQNAVLADGDKPYKNRDAALLDRKARGLNKTHLAQKIEGGFALVPKEEKMAAQIASAKPKQPSVEVITLNEIPKTLIIEIQTEAGPTNVNAFKAMVAANQEVSRLQKLRACL